jgi:hypothetical protein
LDGRVTRCPSPFPAAELDHWRSIDLRDGFLTVRLDPLPTRRATTAIAELCEHLTATHSRYPGTNLTLRYEIKTRP